MGDLNDEIQNRAICDDTQQRNVDLILDGLVERLAVDSLSNAGKNPYLNSGIPIHAFSSKSSGSTSTYSTYTVPASKIAYIYGWGVSSEGEMTTELQINGTAKDEFIGKDGNNVTRGQHQTTWDKVPLKAVAGEVIRIRKTDGGSKPTATLFWGVEVDA